MIILCNKKRLKVINKYQKKEGFQHKTLTYKKCFTKTQLHLSQNNRGKVINYYLIEKVLLRKII